MTCDPYYTLMTKIENWHRKRRPAIREDVNYQFKKFLFKQLNLIGIEYEWKKFP